MGRKVGSRGLHVLLYSKRVSVLYTLKPVEKRGVQPFLLGMSARIYNHQAKASVAPTCEQITNNPPVSTPNHKPTHIYTSTHLTLRIYTPSPRRVSSTLDIQNATS